MNIEFFQTLENLKQPLMAGLYIHVPFCARKCAYCDFYSVPLAGGPAGDYLQALDRECALLPPGFAPETMFLGGGTPTVLSANDLARLFDLLARRVDLSRVTEWTCEANPGTLDAEKIRALRRAGVNRLSLGVQSFDDRILEFLGRIHTARQAAESFRLLRAEGFENLSLDLIFAVPGAPDGALERDLAQALELGPEHLSVYGLTFEGGTPLARRRDAGEVREVDEEEQLRQYRLVRQSLTSAGFRHYEISNYARPGRECRHNLLYWGPGEYLGLGPAAHSHWAGRRWGNVRNLEAWAAALEQGRAPREFEEALEPEARARETLVFSLRRLDGVERAGFQAETGFDYHALRGEEIAWLVRLGMLEETDDRLRLTEKGLIVSDAVFAELV